MKPLARNLTFFAILIVLFSLAIGGTVSASDAEQSFQQPIVVVNTSFLNVRTGPGAEYTVLVTVVGGTELPVLGVFEDGVWYQVNTDAGPGWINIEFTLPRGDFSNLPLLDVGETGAPNVNLGQGGGFAAPLSSSITGQRITGASVLGKDMHAEPTYDSIIINSSVPNDLSTVYPLLGVQTDTAGTTWYLVDVPNVGRGWMDAVELRVLACAGQNVGVTVADTPIRFDGISTQDSYILPGGTEGYLGAFTGTSNQFVYFELTDGTVGIVSFSVIAPRTGITSVCDGVPTVASLGQGGGANATTATAGTRTTVPVIAPNTVIINTGFLNLRSGPSAGFSIVATVSGGTELVVLGRATDNVWYLVQGDFGQGWLNNEFTLFRGNYSTVPVISEPVILGTAGTNAGQGGGFAAPTSVVTGRSVTGAALLGKDMHAQPTYNSIIVNSSIPNDRNTVYPLLATETDADGNLWYLVDVPHIGRGWMDNVELRVLECGADSVGVLNVEAPIVFDGIADRDSFLLPPGTEFYIVGRRNDLIIIELVDRTVGLIQEFVIDPRTGVESNCTGVTSTVSNQTIGSTSVVTTSNAPIPQVTGNRVVINTGNLNVRSGPNAGFSTVATVPGGSELAVVGRASDGVWYYVEGTFGRGWINSEFVLFRGDYGTVPVVDLSGS